MSTPTPRTPWLDVIVEVDACRFGLWHLLLADGCLSLAGRVLSIGLVLQESLRVLPDSPPYPGWSWQHVQRDGALFFEACRAGVALLKAGERQAACTARLNVLEKTVAAVGRTETPPTALVPKGQKPSNKPAKRSPYK